MFEPPDGHEDLRGDAAERLACAPLRRLFVDDTVGEVVARKPQPQACYALASSVRAKLPAQSRADYLVLFVVQHLGDGEYERLMQGMVDGTLPADTINRVTHAVATWGTARPTVPSSR